MRKVAIVGVGQLPFKSRYIDKTYRSLAFEATKKVLSDAGLTPQDIDSVVYAIYCDLMMRQQMPDIYVHDYIGMNGKGSLRISAGAATGGHALRGGFLEVASGMSDVVLVLGVQKGMDFYDFNTKQRGEGLLKGFSISGDVTWLQPVMPGVPAYLASLVNAHVERYGGPTPKQMAKVAVKNHKNALANPIAELKLDLTVEDVLNARIIAWPVTIYECCLYSEGAAALILASEEKAREITKNPIWITGIATRDYATHRFEPETWGRLPSVNAAAKAAYAMAGVHDPRKEFDVIELHDLISGVEILAYEELGLCGLGEGGRLVDEGVVEMSGDLPVNPSGGRVACGHVASVSELSSVGDVARQLRGDAGPLQVPIRRGRGLIEDIDGTGSQADVIILER